MALRQLNTAPKVEDFTPLQEHQEQTPSTFFGAKPVLYAQYSDLTLAARAGDLQSATPLSNFSSAREGEGEDAFITGVDIWVNSENLILFQNTPTPTGVAIPYPAIALHATMKYQSRVEALMMNLSLNDASTVNDAEDIDVLELIVLPPGYSTEGPHTSCIKEIFGAMNTCADLHPDPDDDEDGDGIVDETAPGATGWITAENMDEYLDEDGNFRGTVIGDDLGPGAGTVRQRDDEPVDETNGVNGEPHEEKYQRTG